MGYAGWVVSKKTNRCPQATTDRAATEEAFNEFLSATREVAANEEDDASSPMGTTTMLLENLRDAPRERHTNHAAAQNRSAMARRLQHRKLLTESSGSDGETKIQVKNEPLLVQATTQMI